MCDVRREVASLSDVVFSPSDSHMHNHIRLTASEAHLSPPKVHCSFSDNDVGDELFPARRDALMDSLRSYANQPLRFLARYIRRRPISHAIILSAVLTAVGCSVATQYGVKFLVDTLSRGPKSDHVWLAFALLVSLVAADNLLWRVAGW